MRRHIRTALLALTLSCSAASCAGSHVTPQSALQEIATAISLLWQTYTQFCTVQPQSAACVQLAAAIEKRELARIELVQATPVTK